MQVLLLLHRRINGHFQMSHSDYYHFPFHRICSVTCNENVIRALTTFSFHFRKRFLKYNKLSITSATENDEPPTHRHYVNG